MTEYFVLNRDGKSNFHTHTLYCDGKNSVSEMVDAAINLGFNSIGFSGHQYSVPDAYYAMNSVAEEKYKSDIDNIREEYKDKINVYKGIERDFYCEKTEGFDYVIGSCHHVPVGGEWVEVDASPEQMEEGVNEFFGGDYMAYVKAYYDTESEVLAKTGGQIVGHFDLVTKFNNGNMFFDEESDEYKKIALDAVDRIIDEFVLSDGWKNTSENFPEVLRPAIDTGKPIFEINTGAMIRGLRKKPYPASFIIEHLMRRGVPLLFSSDCHDAKFLNYWFKELGLLIESL